MSKAMSKLLEADPIRYMNVIAAYFPDMVRELIKDQMAEIGMTEQDLRELVRKLESPEGEQYVAVDQKASGLAGPRHHR